MPGEDKPPPNIKRPTIVDPHEVQTTFVDWIVSVGVVEGVLNISLPHDRLFDAPKQR